MTLVLVMAFNTFVALALGFVLGRIYQIRSDELKRRDGFALPPTARIPRPTGAEVSGQASASAAPCRSAIDNRLDRSGTADLFVRSTAATASRRTKAPPRPTSPEHLNDTRALGSIERGRQSQDQVQGQRY